MASAASMPIARELVRLDARPADKAAAIAEAGQLLAAAGCVEPGYAASMARREQAANTFLGHGVAIPHGLGEDRGLVRRNGLAILQIRDGIEWNPGQVAHLVIGIAAASDEHIAILRRLTRLLNDPAALQSLFTTDDAEVIIAALGAEPAAAAPAAPAQDLAERFDWVVDYPAGLHARPATRWVEAARATGCRVQVRHGDQAAEATALVGLLQLGLRPGDRITVSADGRDAAAALARLRATITGLSAQEKADAALAAQRAAAPVRGWEPAGPLVALAGIGASPGLAIGRVHVLTQAEAAIPDTPLPLAEGGARLEAAIRATRAQLKALEDDTARRLGPGEAAIFRAHAGLLEDPDLITLTCQLMVEGHGLAWSWHQAVERVAGSLAALGNPVLAGRAADLRDVGRRVLAQIDPTLAGGSLASLPEGPVILVAEDLAPSDTAGLDPKRVVGLATAAGGPTSHTAILARTLGLPAMVAGTAALLDLPPSTEAVLDGGAGRLHLSPGEADLAAARAFLAAQGEQRAREAALRAEPAVTRDGHRIEVAANINTPDQAGFALAQGAEGVGLMRTEFLFLERGDTPDEADQHAIYRAMLAALEGRPLIVRALDIGGDKQVPHLRLPVEANPFLGVRGARLLLRRPDLMEPQLRALYRAAAAGGPLSIMFPMVTSVPEVIALRAACERIRAELGAPAVPLGIMVEVPAAAVQADALARHVDFFSVGTNDLTQYTLAIDRQNPDLAAEADSLHPAVLRLIGQTVEAATRHGRWVGVCGGLAGEPFGAALLAGLGVAELSMTPRDIPAVKAALRGAELAGLRDLAARALACGTAEEVRALEPALRAMTQPAAQVAA
ncbi:phosphoenolpyruvate--protein phosphotransferase [Roseicella frigidaeris]|uniref:phosphoenolpyruvate--protein phosphotransferase n=1 Tax=Roseicella frigidaeris TaxID=2230885 RepID=A0A327MFT7_9PROT|nr:phosphoenolpyruvate--protein phosphotransferase [Roseicella frigidaeris]RAI60923.1 phosphoenolpyruvate--protein phosphotransferase [Roseicella frigidaeris]